MKLSELKVDGGACRDKFLMQFQADIMDSVIRRPVTRETTALGAAYLAGITAGFWKNQDEVRTKWQCDMTFKPEMDGSHRSELISGWHRAVDRSRGWAAAD